MTKLTLLLLAALSIAFAPSCFAATATMPDCAYATVDNFINHGSTEDGKTFTRGDTVSLPTCTATWNTALVITQGVSIIGNGAANTVITSGITASSSTFDGTNYPIVYNPDATAVSSNETFRVSALTLDMNNTSGGIAIVGTSTSWITNIKIDSNVFRNNVQGTYSPRVIVVKGTFAGVIWNNTFTDIYTAFNAYGLQGTSWDALTYAFGSEYNIFFEGNTVSHTSTPIAGGQGGRYVARHNTFTYTGSTSLSPWFDAHGNQPSGVYATMGVEIYNNALTSPANKGVRMFDHRGGMAYIYKNNVTTTASVDATVREEYDDAISAETNEQPQHVSASYYWSNTKNGTTTVNATLGSNCCNTTAGTCVPCTVETHGYTVAENTSFWNSAAEYTPYTCPHPLADPGATGYCNPAIAGTTGYNLDAGGDPVPYAVTPSVTSGSGTISPVVAEAVLSGADSSTYTATPENGWKVASWTNTACGTATTCQWTNVTENKDMAVTFSEIKLMPW